MAWSKYALTTLFGTNTTQTASQLILQKSNLTPYGLAANSNNTAEQLIAALAIRMVAIAPSTNTSYLMQCSRWGQTYPTDNTGKRWKNDIILIQFNNNPIKENNKLFNPDDFR
jgi:putative heme iron utilization protein